MLDLEKSSNAVAKKNEAETSHLKTPETRLIDLLEHGLGLDAGVVWPEVLVLLHLLLQAEHLAL